MDLDQGSETDELRAAITILEKESSLPRRSRSSEIGTSVDRINSYGYEHGIANNDLERVVIILAKANELDQTASTTLIKNLFPSQSIPSSIVLKVLAGLGQGAFKPNLATQGELLRWICNVHQVLAEPEYLLRFYALFFNLLDILAIRAPLCHLLVLLTRRRHVKPFRVQRLLTLCTQYVNDPNLIYLLKIYKHFWPDIIISQNLPKRSLSLAQQDTEWRARLALVQSVTSSNPTRDNGFSLARNTGARSNKIIPDAHTFRAADAIVTLEDIDSVETFVNKFDLIEPPSQLIAGLHDPLLQKYLHLNTSPDASLRLEYWLQRSLDEELELVEQGFGASSSLRELLAALLSYTEYTKELHLVVVAFFTSYLSKWDGYTNQGLILDLLAYLPPSYFSHLNTSMLDPLEKAILHGATTPLSTLFSFYTTLSYHWLTLLISLATTNKTRRKSEITDALQDLDSHVSTIALNALSQLQSEEATSSVLTYYRTSIDLLASSIPALTNTRASLATPIHIPFPPPPLFNLFLFSSSPNLLSHASATLSSLKTLLETFILASRPLPNPAMANALNAHLMDAVNLIWRSRAFKRADSTSRNNSTVALLDLGCLQSDFAIEMWNSYLELVNESDVAHELTLESAFGLSWNSATSSMARTAWLEKEDDDDDDGDGDDDDEPVSQRVIGSENWKKYRVWVLDWMEQRGVGGMKELVGNVVKNAFS